MFNYYHFRFVRCTIDNINAVTRLYYYMDVYTRNVVGLVWPCTPVSDNCKDVRTGGVRAISAEPRLVRGRLRGVYAWMKIRTWTLIT